MQIKLLLLLLLLLMMPTDNISRSLKILFMEEIFTKANLQITCRLVHIHVHLASLFQSTKFQLIIGRRRELFQTLEVFSTYNVSTTVSKLGVEIGEKFSHCLLSSQKLLYKTACSTALVFYLNRTEIFELIGSGFVVADNFHSKFLV